MPASDRLIWSTADRGLEQSALASPSVEPLAADAPVYPHMQVFAAGRLIAGQGADGSFDVIGSQSGSTLNTLPGAPTAQVKEAWAGRLLVLWIPGQTLQFWGTP